MGSPGARVPSSSGGSPRHASTGAAHLANLASLVLAVALLCSLAYIFQRQHVELDASLQPAAAPGFSSRPPRWSDVWQVAVASSDAQQFVARLLAADLVHDPAGPAPAHRGPLRRLARRGGTSLSAISPGRHADMRALPGRSHGDGSSSKAAAGQAGRDGGPPPLSPQLARSVAVNNTIIVAVGNLATLQFIRSWAYHVRKQGYTNWLVGATDKALGTALVSEGIPCFALYNDTHAEAVSSGDLHWGKGDFWRMGRLKIEMMRDLLSPAYGLHVVALDTDVMVVGDILAHFELFPEADALMSSDVLHTSIEVGDDGLEKADKAMEWGIPVNMGLMLLRNRPSTIKMMDEWLAILSTDSKMWDQGGLNLVVRQGVTWPKPTLHPTHPKLVMCMNGSLALGVLSVSRFPNGHTYFAQRLHEVQGTTPLAVHPTYNFGGNWGKKERLRDAMLFDDPPSHWTGDSFIMVNVPKTPSMMSAQFEREFNATQKKAYHLRGLKMQIEPVYAGIGMAHLFNRSIILPPIACYCDKNWNPLDNCRTVGALKMRLPYLCPMDYVLDPEAWVKPINNNTFMPRWREPSFLDNPRCPPDLRRDRLSVFINKGKAPGSALEEHWTAQDGLAVVLPPGLTDLELQDALRPYRHIRIWWFADAAATFKAFSDSATQAAWQERLSILYMGVDYWRWPVT